jgi:2-oxoglutarate dehydrogenase E2 component (dihydrolipoamide succinyltransferase)
MANIEIPIPAMGEGITEAIVQRFLKNVGDSVEDDEPIADISTDKVDNELVAPQSGIILKFLAKEGETVKVGQAVILLEVFDVKNQSSTNNEENISNTFSQKLPLIKPNPVAQEKVIIDKDILHISKTPSGKFLSPLVRNIAKIENLSLDELDSLSGSGKGNRLTGDDLKLYLVEKFKKKASNINHSSQKSSNKQVIFDGTSEIIEMDRIRSLISENMMASKKTSAHVTSFIEVDLSNIVAWREKVKTNMMNKYEEKLTYTPIFIEVISQAIQEFPMINISVENSKIILKKFINIGMATALPNGNLIVPVIKNVENMNLLDITKKVNDLANRARQNKLKPDEIKNGTFTLSNLGLFGTIAGTPIINQPEAAILAIGAIKKRPVVIETSQGDTIGIRQMMIMSMSFDHRVIDGALGGNFLKRVAELFESFDVNRNI